MDMLQNDPATLLTHYQPIVNVVVSKLIRRGFFSVDEKMDVVQQVNTVLLEKKLAQIQRNYNGTVLLSTYFSKVVYNHCLEIVRGTTKQAVLHSDQLLSNTKDENLSIEDRLIIDDEKTRLEAILKGVVGLSLRTIIALKLFARVIITLRDYQEVMYVEDELSKNFEEIFFNDYSDMNDKEVYQSAIPFLNRITEKKIDSDSHRKWINMTVDRIAELLNGNPPRSAYNRETVKILVQLYFEHKEKNS